MTVDQIHIEMMEPRQRAVSIERLRELFPDAVWRCEKLPAALDAVADDSRNVTPGAAFVAIVGYETDGHLFLAKARDAGADLLVAELGQVESRPELLEPVEESAILLVANTRLAASILAAEFYGHPSREIRVHGVTGTKGKTTSVHLIAYILSADGRSPAVMGTLGIEFGSDVWKSDLTTPGPIEFQKILRLLVDKGATDIACEVSAHAGALSRTTAVRFETVTYLNLSRDHGDHFTPEGYLEAKMAISRDAVGMNPDVWGIGNARDPYTRSFLEPIAPERRLTFTAHDIGEEPTEPCDLVARIVSRSPDHLEMMIQAKTWERSVSLPLIGRFNAENAAAAAAVAVATGIDPDAIVRGLSEARPIAGRLEKIDKGQDFLVVVDYAHAPQPAEEALACLRELTEGKLIAVMGAGGSRDRGKRPMIGEVLARDCDVAVITSDNPRKEEPLDIINDILVGARRVKDPRAEIIAEVDRRKAIETALELARAGDTVAILGKGHETYQIFRDKTIHFDDREVVREWLEGHGYGGVEE